MVLQENLNEQTKCQQYSPVVISEIILETSSKQKVDFTKAIRPVIGLVVWGLPFQLIEHLAVKGLLAPIGRIVDKDVHIMSLKRRSQSKLEYGS